MADDSAGVDRRAARPRDAASLVLLREHAGRRVVLMGRRNSRHGFLPGLYVFPGGGVEALDRGATCASELDEAVLAALARSGGRRKARALAVAAVRETFEEAGLLLGEMATPTLRPRLDGLLFIARAITPARLRTRFDARFFIARENDSRRSCHPASGELQDLRWIDPECPDSALPMLDVTRFVLRQVVELGAWRQPGSVPLYFYRDGRVMVRRG